MKTLKKLSAGLLIAALCTAFAVQAAVLDVVAVGAAVMLVAEGGLPEIQAAVDKALKAMEDNTKRHQDLLSNALEEVRKEGSIHAETNKKLGELGTEFKAMNDRFGADITELKAKVLEVKQAGASRPAGGIAKTAGQIVAESAEFKAIDERNPTMRAVTVPGFYNVVTTDNTAVSATTGELVQPQRTGLYMSQQMPLTLLDILNRRPTNSNMIEFVRQTTRTNNAGVQGAGTSPSGQYDGQAYGQSNMAWTLYQAPVRTIGTFIPASRQILSDAAQLQGRIDGELRYMLGVKREDQLLNGDGTGGNIDGLLNQASDFNGGVTNATALDTILRAFLQLTLAYYQADAVALNPTDWHNIVMLKDTQGRYLFSDPQSGARPALWGRAVAQCFSLSAGTFLAGNFAMGATVWDRQDASVRIAEQHDDFAIRGMVAVIADERLALEVSHPAAFVTGNVSHAG